MGLSLLSFFALIIPLLGVVMDGIGARNSSFDVNYSITWGNDHVLPLNQGREIQLSMDKFSGAGFGSKLNYGSGFFHWRIKLPDKDSAGVTAFYLTSHSDNHDELDFEFLGNREGKPYTLQTNVFSNGQGNREQRILLWFDPTADYHTYKILWNQHQIVFYVDNIPIRVFKNNTKIGVSYPTQTMQLELSLWDGDSWATDGGQTKTNWSYAPFKVVHPHMAAYEQVASYLRIFNLQYCPSCFYYGNPMMVTTTLLFNCGHFIIMNVLFLKIQTRMIHADAPLDDDDDSKDVVNVGSTYG